MALKVFFLLPFVEIKIYFQKFAHFNQILDSYKIVPPHKCMDFYLEKCITMPA